MKPTMTTADIAQLADRSHDCRAQRLKCVGNGVVALQAAAAAVVLVRRMMEAA